MTRTRPWLLAILAGALACGLVTSFVACGGSTPHDMYYGKDAGLDFRPPDLASPTDTGTAGTGGTDAAETTSGTAGVGGSGGAAGSDAAVDADAAVSDGGAGLGEAGQ